MDPASVASLAKESLSVANTYLPEITAAVGYAGGQIAERFAVRGAAESHRPLLEAWNIHETQTSRSKATHRQNMARFVGRAITPLALAGGIMGALTAAAWVSPGPSETVASYLDIVVDHSGPTSLKLEGQPSQITTIDRIAQSFEGSDINVETEVTRDDQVYSLSLADIGNTIYSPDGNADLDTAFTHALSFVQTQSDASATRPNGEVLVITNGNDFGNVQQVISSANAKNTPVSVVNVGGPDFSTTQTNADLISIANKTKGKYWDVTDDTVKAIRTKVEAEVAQAPTHNHEKEKGNNLLKGADIASVLLGVVLYKNRKLMPLQRNGLRPIKARKASRK